jgi:3-oxoacyl-[acyl-carrier protein] reductase
MTTNKVAVVTGAARGIGFAIAQRLTSRGVHVILVDKLDSVRESASRLRAQGASAEAAAADIANESNIRSLFADIAATHQRCDILVNNAGVSPKYEGRKRLTVDTTLSEWQTVLRVNLTGPFLMCRECLPLMQRRGWGRIVNMSSIAGRTGSRFPSSVYSASKAGLIGFSRVLAGQVGNAGITVNCVAPGRIVTPHSTLGGPELEAEYAARVPIGRLGDPDDVAGSVEFLTSEEAGFITGAVVDVNGGVFMN